jgi:hypothetical protein
VTSWSWQDRDMSHEYSLEPDVRTASVVGAGAYGAAALGAFALGAVALGAVARSIENLPPE